ncbi:MAG: hypothetical protein KAQ97_05520, partial [Candidatus Fermentibacteraceae bacterium]|nr:hypothetical protein [Candidatus Fermentibacteraceae bacterium]
MSNSGTGRNRKLRILLVFALVIVIAGGLGYRYRGAIRLKMLDVLHSFDDEPAAPDSLEWMDEMPPGCWWPARDLSDESPLTQDQQEQIDRIQSLGYLSGYEDAPYVAGVTILREDAYPGYNIIISGHGPGVTMIDMEGNQVHDWYTPEVSLYGIWPDAQDKTIPVDFWRRTHLEEDGDLIVMVECGGVVKVDKDSNLLWASEFNGAHHDICVSDITGDIYVISRNIHINPEYSSTELLIEDYVCVLDSMGNEIEIFSILDAIKNSPYAPILRRMPPSGDVLHTNTIELIEEGDLPEGYAGLLRENSLILSMRTIDLVCVIDLETRTAYWAESDLWRMQHQPSLLENGNMLVYDNQGHVNASTVLEFSPETREVVWMYRGSDEALFYSIG